MNMKEAFTPSPTVTRPVDATAVLKMLCRRETDSIRPLNPSVPLWRVFSFVTLGGAPAPSLLPDGACTYYKKDFFFNSTIHKLKKGSINIYYQNISKGLSVY